MQIHRTQKSIKMKKNIVSPVKRGGKVIRLKSDEILARGSESASVHSRLGTPGVNSSKAMSKLANRIGKVSISSQSSRKIIKRVEGNGGSVFDRLGGGSRSF